MAVFETELNVVKQDITEIKGEIRAMRSDTTREFRELNVKLVGRPSWALLALITLLSSALAGTIVALAMGR